MAAATAAADAARRDRRRACSTIPGAARAGPRRCRCSAGCTRCSTGPARRRGCWRSTPGLGRPRPREPLRRRHALLVTRRNAGRRRARDRQRRPSRLGDARRRCAADRRRGDRILTRHPAPPSLPGNVRWRAGRLAPSACSSDAEVREAFRSAAVVVVPVQGRAAAVGPERDAAGVGLRAPRRPHADARPLGSRGAPRRRERPARAARRPGRARASGEPRPRRPGGRRVARTVGAGDRRGDAPPSRATRRGCSRSARRRAPVPDGTRSTVRGDGTANEAARRARPRPLGARPRRRARADGARSPRGPLRARRPRDLPRARATAVGRRQPVPPRARGRAPAPRPRRSRRTGSRAGRTRASSTRSTSTWRGSGGSPATTCAWSTGSTGRSACTAASTTAPTRGSPR